MSGNRNLLKLLELSANAPGCRPAHREKLLAAAEQERAKLAARDELKAQLRRKWGW